jgi:putative RNA 2'-phosphotransferase
LKLDDELMTDKKLIQLSRFLSFVLRHKPEAIGLELDQNGWVNVDMLIEAVIQSGRHLTREILAEIVVTDDKQRYAFSPDKKLIRASQGHSINVDLVLTPIEPPELLYHGTAIRFAAQIMQEGLKPQNRQYVHLSTDDKTASSVGSRHGKPTIVLTVLAQKMHEDGQLFYLSENKIWLVEYIKPEYLMLMK